MRARTWALLLLLAALWPLSIPTKPKPRSAPRPHQFEDGELRHLADLTPTQREIVCAVAVGYSNAEIADRLGMAHPTVKNHLTEVYRQTGLMSQRALIAWVVSEADPRWRVKTREIEERLRNLPPHFCKGKRFVHTSGVVECVRFVLMGQTRKPT